MKIKSLTLRISIVVTIMTLFVLMATLLTVYATALNNHKKEAAHETHNKLDLVVERLSKLQSSVEQTANYSIPAIESCMNDTTAVMDILIHIVKSNKNVNCAALAYAPNRLPGHPYCIPTAVQYGTVNHYFSDKDLDGDYVHEDWYIAPALKGMPFWTDPYFTLLDIPVISYAVPVISKERGFEGVLTLAVELTSLSSFLTFSQEETEDSTKYNTKGMGIILDRNTTFLTSRNKELAMNETLFTLAESSNDTIYSYIGNEIRAHRDGEKIVTMDNDKSVVTWRVLPVMDWTAMVITPYSEVYASVNALTSTTIIVALLAALAAIVIIYFSVRRVLKPFNRLKAATCLLGEGKYDVELPYSLTSRADEIGDLGREFIRMEKAVKKNIDSLEKERQLLERSYEMLSTLMHNVVGHMRIPFNNLLNFNNALATLANDSEEAQIIKHDAQEAGQSILLQFRQLNELVDLISSRNENDETMILISSEDFFDYIVKGAQQLQNLYQLNIRENYHDKRRLNIRANTHVLESLLYELIIEAARVSKVNDIGLNFRFATDMSALRIMIEAKTDNPIPEDEKPDFFKRFAQQKVNAYATSELLPLYICYMIAKRQGFKLYVEPKGLQVCKSNVFILEIPKAEEQQS